MKAVVSIISRHYLGIEACRINQPDKTNLVLYKPLIKLYGHLKQLYISNKTEHFSYKCI